jgi:hypothetical protein
VEVKQLEKKQPFIFGEETLENFFTRFRVVEYKTMAFVAIVT